MRQHSPVVIQHARRYSDVFAGLVLRDERDGQPITMAPVHHRLHQLADAHQLLLLKGPPGLGKSQQVTIARTVWELGRDPSLRFAIVSATDNQATKLGRAIMSLVEHSPEVRSVFPNLRPGALWTQAAFDVAGKPRGQKDASVELGSVESGRFVGGRFDRIILDDAQSTTNVATVTARESLYAWHASTFGARRAPHTREIVIGHAAFKDDLYARLADLPGWHDEAIPIFESSGASAWPERWPLEAIEERRRELGPVAFARTFLAQPTDQGLLCFSTDDVEEAARMGLQQPEFFVRPPGRVVFGVDVAFSTSSSADLSAYSVVCERDDGSRELLHVDSGRWVVDDLCARVLSSAAQYRPSSIAVETNGGGAIVEQQLRAKLGALVRGYHTGKGSWDARTDWFAAEMAQRRWRFNRAAAHAGHSEQMRALIHDATFYVAGEHVPDRLSATLLALEDLRTRRPGKVQVVPMNWGGQRGQRIQAAQQPTFDPRGIPSSLTFGRR